MLGQLHKCLVLSDPAQDVRKDPQAALQPRKLIVEQADAHGRGTNAAVRGCRLRGENRSPMLGRVGRELLGPPGLRQLEPHMQRAWVRAHRKLAQNRQSELLPTRCLGSLLGRQGKRRPVLDPPRGHMGRKR